MILPNGKQILFKQCQDTYKHQPHNALKIGANNSYIVTSFEISDIWEFGHFKIHPSRKIDLPNRHFGLISKVECNSPFANTVFQAFATFIATLLTFSTGKKALAPNEIAPFNNRELAPEEELSIALHLPLTEMGPRKTVTKKSQDWEHRAKKNMEGLIDQLANRDFPEKKRTQIVQTIRLFSLSVLTKEIDFGLAYLLTAAAIESAAQQAIKPDEVSELPPKYEAWKEKAEREDGDFRELFREYEQNRNKSNLKARYTKFIFDYSSVEEWHKEIEHPNQEAYDILPAEAKPHFEFMIRKNQGEYYPEDLDHDELHRIIGKTYAHRSGFIHEGVQPPHTDAATTNKFFQQLTTIAHAERKPNQSIEQFIKTVKQIKPKFELLPNIELMTTIGMISIRNWINSLQPTPHPL
ncbi:hypothetical protein ACTORR_01320 [Pseudomonas sp. SAR267]|uniref:hypothetical protein n=1 Tax=Pseudomonas sp. SAR267 TaxID=3454502 RepID=UPI003F9340EE